MNEPSAHGDVVVLKSGACWVLQDPRCVEPVLQGLVGAVNALGCDRFPEVRAAMQRMMALPPKSAVAGGGA